MSVMRTGRYTTAAAGGYQTYPAGYAAYLLPQAGVGAWGSWVEVTSSTASEIAIVGATTHAAANVYDVYLDIGTGGAGAEVTVASIAVGAMFSSYDKGASVTHLPYPVVVPAGTRIAVRVAASTNSNIYVAVLYLPTGYIR